MKDGYIYIWEYVVHEDSLGNFLKAYGPDGDWANLFRGSKGYLKTELLRDRENPLRFLTIDYWESIEAFQAFRSEKAVEFEALDKKCEAFMLEERQIGLFSSFHSPHEKNL